MPELTLDLFNSDAFRSITLTGWVNERVPFQPTFLSSLGLVAAEGVYTTDVAFDEVNGVLRLISSSPRGSAPSQSQNPKGKTRMLSTTRLAREAVITADQIAKVRQLGTATALETLERVVQKRIEGPVGLKAELAYTKEYMYLGMIDGIVYDADGSTVLWDCFDTFGVSRPDSVALPVVQTGELKTPLKKKLNELRRLVVKELGGMSLAGASFMVLCGDSFYDAVENAPERVDLLKVGATGNSNAAAQIAKNGAYSSFTYGDFTFVNYRGSDDGEVGIPDAGGRVVPVGVPGLFQEFNAPADTLDFVNTEGLPSYLLQRRERQLESSRAFEVQANPLAVCMRPKALRRLTLA
jgi:hypothetical protein